MELIILMGVWFMYEHAKSVGMVEGYEHNQSETNKSWRHE